MLMLALELVWDCSKMKVYKASEADLDRRLMLDKRKTKEAFCRNFYESDAMIPVGFCELQDKIRDGLEAQVVAKFGDTETSAEPDSFGLPHLHENFLFPADPINSERIILEINNKILNDVLWEIILSFLSNSAPQYCVVAAVFGGKNMKGINYVGRFVVNLEEIAVENSLAEIWSRQMQSLAIEGSSGAEPVDLTS